MAEGKRTEFVFEAEAFQLESGTEGQEDVVALGFQGPGGRLSQVGVGLQGFVKHLSGKSLFMI